MKYTTYIFIYSYIDQLQLLSGQDADNHIFRFVRSKFGFVDETDFETRLYLCLPIFQPLQWSYYEAMSANGAMPVYAALVVLEALCIAATVFRRWSSDGKEKVEKKSNGTNSTSEDDSLGPLAHMVDEAKTYFFTAQLRPGYYYHIGM